jgi:CRP/FNR family transcriptional regulator
MLSDWPEDMAFGPAVEYAAGTVLFRQGDVVRDLFLIETGLVKLIRCEVSAREVIVGLRSCNWLLGAAGATMNRPHATTAETLDASLIRRIRLTDFRRLQRTDLATAYRIQQMLARESFESVASIGALGAMNARGRLERLLAELLRAGGITRADGAMRVSMSLRQYELAEIVGVTTERFSRLLAEVERAGLIRREGGWLWIPCTSRIARTAADRSSHG